MNQVFIDRSKAAFKYDPDIKPRVTIKSGQSIVIETRDPRSGALLCGEPGTLQPYPPPPGGRSNALTGPIKVENAEPGDVLSVQIIKIDPSSIAYMAASDNGFVLPKGSIESAHVGIVAVKERWIEFRDGIKFQKNTMVGCVGVAHPEKPKSGKTGDFGGNFDHSILKEDCTLMLPVFVTGGLLYVGDVHAAMGDGELSGGGVEAAAVVKLKVELTNNYHNQDLKQRIKWLLQDGPMIFMKPGVWLFQICLKLL